METPSDRPGLAPKQATGPSLDAILQQLKQMEVGIANISDKLETLESTRMVFDVHKMWDELRTLFVLIAESHVTTHHVIVEKENLSITKKSLRHFLELYFLASDTPSLTITVNRMFASVLHTTVDDAANTIDVEITFDDFLRLKEVVTGIVPEVDVPYLRPKSGASEFQPSVFFGKQDTPNNIASGRVKMATKYRFRSQSVNTSVVRHVRNHQVDETTPTETGEKAEQRHVWLWLWSDDDDRMLWGLLPTFYDPTPAQRTVHAIIETFSHAITMASVISYFYRLGDNDPNDGPEEVWFTAIFMIEYAIRWMAARPSHKVQRPYSNTDFFVAKLWHMLKFYSVIDVVCILPFWIELGVRQAGDPAVGAGPLRILRLFRLMKLGAHLVVRCRMLVELAMSMKARILDLLVVLVVFGIWILMLGTLVQIFEEHGDQAEMFDTIPKCLWWAIITSTTVGYGDSYPVTNGGYIIGAICALSGAVIMSIPMVFVLITFDEIHFSQAAKHTRAQDAADLFMEWIDRCVPKALAQKEGLQTSDKSDHDVVRMACLPKEPRTQLRQTMKSKREKLEKLTKHRRTLRNALVKALVTENSALLVKMHNSAAATRRHTLNNSLDKHASIEEEEEEEESNVNRDRTIGAPNYPNRPALGRLRGDATSNFADEDSYALSLHPPLSHLLSDDVAPPQSRWTRRDTRSARGTANNDKTEEENTCYVVHSQRTRVTSI